MKTAAILVFFLAQARDDALRETIARALLANYTTGRFDAAAKDFNATMLAAASKAMRTSSRAFS